MCLADRTKEVEQIGRSLTNYLYGYGPMLDIKKKYGIKVRGFLENGRKECYESALHKASCFIKKGL